MSLAHIHLPVSMINELKLIMKRNPLKHLNLSGCLKTAEQVIAVVKKAKKHLSLIAIHLSDIPVIMSD